MELEAADVGFLVLFLLVEAFLELALFLEAMFLGHLFLLFLRLHHAALFAEDAHLAVEHLILAELALQRTVEQRNLDGGLQANLVEAFLAVGEHPGIVARKLVLQSFANHLIGGQQVGCRDALAIGRVGDHDAGLLGLLEVFEVLFADGDEAGESGGLDVQPGCVDGLDVDIVAIDVVMELALQRVVVVYLVEEVGIEVGPLLEGELLAEESWCHVAGNECCLDEQGA